MAQSSADLCRANGWNAGDTIRVQGNNGPPELDWCIVRLTAIGEDTVLARPLRGYDEPGPEFSYPEMGACHCVLVD